MEYSKLVSNYDFEFLKHATSGGTTLDYKSIVGYDVNVTATISKIDFISFAKPNIKKNQLKKVKV